MLKKLVVLTLTVIILFASAWFMKFGDVKLEEKDAPLVAWDEAVKILNSGDVNTAVQTKNLEVIFVLNNGTMVQTKEPETGAIFTEIEKCGDPCKSVATASE